MVEEESATQTEYIPRGGAMATVVAAGCDVGLAGEWVEKGWVTKSLEVGGQPLLLLLT